MFNLFLGTYHPGTQYLLPGDYLVMTRQSSNSLWVQVRAGSGNPRRSRAGEVTWSISFSLWIFWVEFLIKSPQQLRAPVKPTCWGGSSCGTSWHGRYTLSQKYIPEVYSCHVRYTLSEKFHNHNSEVTYMYTDYRILLKSWPLFTGVRPFTHTSFSYEDKSIWDWQFHNEE